MARKFRMWQKWVEYAVSLLNVLRFCYEKKKKNLKKQQQKKSYLKKQQQQQLWRFLICMGFVSQNL